MDGAASLAELVQEILDLVSEVLVLALGIELSDNQTHKYIHNVIYTLTMSNCSKASS